MLEYGEIALSDRRGQGLSFRCAVGTTGAGDIFGGTSVFKLLKTGKSPEKLTFAELYGIAEFACAAAAISIEQYSGIASGTRDELLRMAYTGEK